MKKIFRFSTITLIFVLSLISTKTAEAGCGYQLVETWYEDLHCVTLTVWSYQLGDGACIGDCGNCTYTTEPDCY